MILQGPRDVIRELKRIAPASRAELRCPGGQIYWLWRWGESLTAQELFMARDESGTCRMLDEERLEDALGDGPFDLRSSITYGSNEGPRQQSGASSCRKGNNS